MKKQVGLISLDSSLAQWIWDQLRTAAPHTPAAQELREALGDLMDGSIGSLMLELDPEQPLTAAAGTIHCGALSIDLRLRRVSRDGTDIALTPKEFDILKLLISHPGQVFSSQQIYELVWKEEAINTETIMVHIRKLREKIEANPKKPIYIKVVWGQGYKMENIQ